MVAFTDGRITESSSAAMSSTIDNAFWTCNDENTSPHAFLVDTNTGNTISTFDIDAGHLVDPEAMAVDNQHRLWYFDIGDNDSDRDDCSVLMVSEPTSTGDHGVIGRQRYIIEYPHGPRNAETGLINPVTNERYIISKDSSAGNLYVLPANPQDNGVKNLLTKIPVSLPPGISDGTFTIDGRFVLLTRDDQPTTVTVHDPVQGWQQVGSIPVASQSDREGITMARDGLGFWTTQEGALSTFVYTPLPVTWQPWGSSGTDPGPTPSNPCG